MCFGLEEPPELVVCFILVARLAKKLDVLRVIGHSEIQGKVIFPDGQQERANMIVFLTFPDDPSLLALDAKPVLTILHPFA